MWQGFVTVGRGELLLTLLAVALLMFVVGIAAGQIYLMIRRPAVVKPEPCTMLHCDDEKQLASWLRQRDYSLITNEMLHEMKQRMEFAHRRADRAAESTGRHARTDLLPGPSHPGWPTKEPK